MWNNLVKKKAVRGIIVIIIWLAIWQIASLFVHNSILLVGPFDVIVTLFHKLCQLDFYLSIATSFVKITIGFLTGAMAGVLLAIIAWKNDFIADLLKPLMAFMKAAPVASFVVLFLIWWNSSILSVAICICLVMPQIYVSVYTGLESTDQKMLEMAQIFELSVIDRVHYIYRPQVGSYLKSALKVSAAMSWKAGVAAEVIGTPENSIGNSLYMSKIYLDTAGVLAWTLVIILVSLICEKLLLVLFEKYESHEFACAGSKAGKPGKRPEKLTLTAIKKAYGERQVLNDFSEVYLSGNIYKYDWPSGEGKTTLFRIIAGLEKSDDGVIDPLGYSLTMLFQEDRLVEEFSAVTNVSLVCGNKSKAAKERAVEVLSIFLSEDELYRPCKTLSGGQKRRVAIARALLKDGDIAIFDEPFEGLDDENRTIISKIIEDFANDRIVLVASHI